MFSKNVAWSVKLQDIMYTYPYTRAKQNCARVPPPRPLIELFSAGGILVHGFVIRAKRIKYVCAPQKNNRSHTPM